MGSKGVMALAFASLTPLQPETLLGTNLLELSIGRILGALERGYGLGIWDLNAFTTGTLLGTNLLEVSIGRRYGAHDNLPPPTAVVFWSSNIRVPRQRCTTFFPRFLNLGP